MINEWNVNYEESAIFCHEGVENGVNNLCSNFYDEVQENEQLGLPFELYLKIREDEDASVERLVKKGARRKKQKKDWILKWRHPDGRYDRPSSATIDLMQKISARAVRVEAKRFAKRVKETMDEDLMELNIFPDKKFVQSKVDSYSFW